MAGILILVHDAKNVVGQVHAGGVRSSRRERRTLDRRERAVVIDVEHGDRIRAAIDGEELRSVGIQDHFLIGVERAECESGRHTEPAG
jgi:hypothetical protein